MATNVEVPSLGESVTEAILTQWLKEEGDSIAVDEPICELESDKATVELPSPASGVLHRVKSAGETAQVGEVIAEIVPADESKPEPAGAKEAEGLEKRAAAPTDQAQEPSPKREEKQREPLPPEPKTGRKKNKPASLPRAKRLEKEKPQEQPPKPEPDERPPPEPAPEPGPAAAAEKTAASPDEETGVRRVPMSKIRRSIAERLVRAQQTAAMLTTFNEIDMTAVQEVRARHGEAFQEAHGVSLGLTSFFARACALALQQFPQVNAQLDDGDILFHEHVNLGVAVSTDRGLIVPVLRHVESLSLAQIETEIKRAASAARDGKLSIQDLSGGTFTITNGGVFGSLLSTPLLNPPQSGILGLHAIQDRAVVIDGRIEARPMMYVALTYDHRLVDGRESVSFLVRIKQLIEDPLQMILEI